MVICREIYLESIDNLDGVDGGSDCTPLRRTIVKHAMDRRSRTTNEYTIPYKLIKNLKKKTRAAAAAKKRSLRLRTHRTAQILFNWNVRPIDWD